MLKEEYKVYEDKMRKSIDSVAADFASVRAGRANASVLDRIMVDYYGSPTPIQQIAAISSPDARTLLISPWDKTAVKGIEKAIQNSDLGINPQNDGASIRLNFPQLTEERRKELVKQIRKYAEAGKVAIRNIRRDAMEAFKKKEKSSEITEDDLKQAEKDLQKLTDDSCIAFVTPPVASNLFVAQSMTGLDVVGITKRALPFMAVLIIAMAIVAFVPAVSLGFLSLLG